MDPILTSKATDLLARLPGPISSKWPDGERFVRALSHGSMSVELYAPVGLDSQTPHGQDELYIVHTGQAQLVVEGKHHPCAPGTVIFVPAGADHRFVNFSNDFCTWVVFWGPNGGEAGLS